MFRLAAVVAVSMFFAASAARADSPAAVSIPNAAPAWLLQYTAFAGVARIRVTRYVSTRADGTLTWQQLDVDTGIADNGPMHRCTGSAQLAGEELRAMEDAVQALKERRASAGASPADAGRGTVAVALIVPRDGSQVDVSRLNFDPAASDAEPRLKRAAAILSRYRCPK